MTAHLTVAALSATLLGAPKPELPPVAVRTTIVLKVADQRAAADTLVKITQQYHGYFSSRSDQQLLLKVPRDSLAKVLAEAEKLGPIIQSTRQAQNLTFELEKNKALLGSRQEVLQRYFAVMAEASANSVTTVEREMTTLVQQIETLKGQIRMLEHRMRYAELLVAFRFPERKMPIPDGSSSFDWLNTMNLVDLNREFQRHED